MCAFCHFSALGITLIRYSVVIKIYKHLFVLTTVWHSDLYTFLKHSWLKKKLHVLKISYCICFHFNCHGNT